MPQVTFPALADVRENNIVPFFPHQIALPSRYTGAEQVLNTGYPTWRGTLNVAEVGNGDESLALEIETFFASLEGIANWANIPTNRPSIPNNLTVSTVSSIGGYLVHTVAGDVAEIAIGQCCESSNKLFRVRAITGSNITFDPQRPITAGDTISTTTTVLVKALQKDFRPLRRIPDWWGPWSFEWKELI